MGKSKRPTPFMPADQPQANQIFPLFFGGDAAQIVWINALAQHSRRSKSIPRSLKITPYRTSLHVPASSKTALAPLPAQGQFWRFRRSLCADHLLPPHRGQTPRCGILFHVLAEPCTAMVSGDTHPTDTSTGIPDGRPLKISCHLLGVTGTKSRCRSPPRPPDPAG